MIDVNVMSRLKTAISRLAYMNLSCLCLGDQFAIETCVSEFPVLLEAYEAEKAKAAALESEQKKAGIYACDCCKGCQTIGCDKTVT